MKMAKKYGVSAARLCIRYVLQLGAVALPKTANPTHMANNADVNFTISEEDMEALKIWNTSLTTVNLTYFPCSVESLWYEEGNMK